MNYNILEKNIKNLEKFAKQAEKIETSVNRTSDEFTSTVIELSKNEVKPDSDDGKKFIDLTNIVRSIGHKLLNLLEINISCTFAGATLFTWSLPKIKDNKAVYNNINKVNSKNL